MSASEPAIDIPTWTRSERRLHGVTRDAQRYGSASGSPFAAPEDALKVVERGVCPYCGSGPFTVVAIHVASAHEIDKHQFRDDLGLTKSASVCDPAHSRAASLRGRQMYASGRSGIADPENVERGRQVKRSFTRAGREVQAEKLQKVSPEARKAAGVKAGARRLAQAAPRDAVILECYRSGEALMSIAGSMGVALATVRAAIQRVDVDMVDGRTRAAERRRGHDTPALVAGRATFALNQEAVWGARLAAYRSGAGLVELASREGISRKSLVEGLKRRGADVPDGRSDKAVEMCRFVCPECGDAAEKPASIVRSNRKHGWAGPFCGMSCAGKHRQRNR